MSDHNAADAISGLMWLDRVTGTDKIFYTTGRLTSEIVMKAAHMGIPAILSRSGVTHMGLELAEDLGLIMIARAKAGTSSSTTAPTGSSSTRSPHGVRRRGRPPPPPERPRRHGESEEPLARRGSPASVTEPRNVLAVPCVARAAGRSNLRHAPMPALGPRESAQAPAMECARAPESGHAFIAKPRRSGTSRWNGP